MHVDGMKVLTQVLVKLALQLALAPEQNSAIASDRDDSDDKDNDEDDGDDRTISSGEWEPT